MPHVGCACQGIGGLVPLDSPKEEVSLITCGWAWQKGTKWKPGAQRLGSAAALEDPCASASPSPSTWKGDDPFWMRAGEAPPSPHPPWQRAVPGASQSSKRGSAVQLFVSMQRANPFLEAYNTPGLWIESENSPPSTLPKVFNTILKSYLRKQRLSMFFI